MQPSIDTTLPGSSIGEIIESVNVEKPSAPSSPSAGAPVFVLASLPTAGSDLHSDCFTGELDAVGAAVRASPTSVHSEFTPPQPRRTFEVPSLSTFPSDRFLAAAVGSTLQLTPLVTGRDSHPPIETDSDSDDENAKRGLRSIAKPLDFTEPKGSPDSEVARILTPKVTAAAPAASAAGIASDATDISAIGAAASASSTPFAGILRTNSTQTNPVIEDARELRTPTPITPSAAINQDPTSPKIALATTIINSLVRTLQWGLNQLPSAERFEALVALSSCGYFMYNKGIEYFISIIPPVTFVTLSALSLTIFASDSTKVSQGLYTAFLCGTMIASHLCDNTNYGFYAIGSSINLKIFQKMADRRTNATPEVSSL